MINNKKYSPSYMTHWVQTVSQKSENLIECDFSETFLLSDVLNTLYKTNVVMWNEKEVRRRDVPDVC